MKTEKDKQDEADKPKKLYDITYAIWDDGDVRCLIKEIIPQDRGAPIKWTLDSDEFVKSLKACLGDEKIKILEEMASKLGITANELQIYYGGKKSSSNTISMPTKQVSVTTDEPADEFNFDSGAKTKA